MSKVVNMVGGGSSGTPRKYLVKDGLAVNGNLVALGMKVSSPSSASPVTPPIVYNTGSATCGWTSTGGQTGYAGIVYCDESVDFSQYDKLFIYGRWRYYTSVQSATSNLSYNLWSSIGTYQIDNRIIQVPASGLKNANGTEFNAACQLDQTGVLMCDLTQLATRPSGLVGFNFGQYVSNYFNIILYDIWLE